MTRVADFFDEQAEDYRSRNHGMRAFHELVAREIEAGVAGDVLCVGGLWLQANVPANARLTVVDISAAMLRAWQQQGHSTVQADARDLPFSKQSFDHVVLPLMLHHVAGDSVPEAQAHAARVLGEVRRVLRPGGVCWISEFCVSSTVYALERIAAPVTRRILALRRIPLVVMHSEAFYRDALTAAGFTATLAKPVQPRRARPWDVVTPVIGVPWLKVPRALYPLTPTLIQARRGC